MFKNAKRHLVFGLLLGGLGMATVQVLKAQAVSNATVTGRVVDEQEAVVSGAQIRMTAVNTGAVVNAVPTGKASIRSRICRSVNIRFRRHPRDSRLMCRPEFYCV